MKQILNFVKIIYSAGMGQWFLISFIVGIVLALTGSGGGLVSIPLFTQFAHFDLKVATTLSLLTVMIGAFFAWLPQRRHTQIVSSILMFTMSFASSGITSEFKSQLSMPWIRALIIALCVFSLIQFWKSKPQSKSTPTHNAPHKLSVIFIIKNLLIGFVLGIITTLTGLGGGVLLVPLMLGFLGYNLVEAIPTSLLTIMFASAGSLWFQRKILMTNTNATIVIVLVCGVLASSVFFKFLIQKTSAEKLTLYKKITFTLVVCWTIISLLLKT